jgi:alpha-galactosidase/6-phospho-beta-glucosidase family protein
VSSTASQAGGLRGRPKIVVLGAGSADFGIDCLAGIFRTPGLRGSVLVLVDIDREKLDLAERIARRLNDLTGAEIEVLATSSRVDALPGADFVILAVAIDREQTWSRDHEVALRYGITHYAENGGPGAFAHTCRNLGLVLPIVRDIEQLCPSAHVLALTNPLTRICSAINTATRLRFVGICHGIGIGYWIVATAMHRELGLALPDDPRFLWRDDMIEHFEYSQRVSKERYSIRAAGINHFSWILAVRDLETGERVAACPPASARSSPRSSRSRDDSDIFGIGSSDTHISGTCRSTAIPTPGRIRHPALRLLVGKERKAPRASREVDGGQRDAGRWDLGADGERIEFVICHHQRMGTRRH